MPLAAEREAGRAPLGDLFSQLVSDGKLWLQAETTFYRAEAQRRLIGAGIAVGLFAAAAVLSFAALSAALFGAILAVTPMFGAGWATAVVTLGAVVVALVLALLGRWRWRLALRRNAP